MDNAKCPQCGLVNWTKADACKRCGAALGGDVRFEDRTARTQDAAKYQNESETKQPSFLKRAAVVVGIIAVFLIGSYLSLIFTSDPLNAEQKQQVERAIDVLSSRGFASEARLLRFANFRSSDNWWNRYIGHREAFAATNFPFEVVTLYPDFFTLSVDDTERAAILLHESFHLRGKKEPEAHAGVWELKTKLGWTRSRYENTPVFRSTREFTQNYAPQFFVCGASGHEDCVQ